MSRHQARRPNNRVQVIAFAILLLIAVALGFGVAYLVVPAGAPSETPSPATTAGAVETATPSDRTASPATPSASPLGTASAVPDPSVPVAPSPATTAPVPPASATSPTPAPTPTTTSAPTAGRTPAPTARASPSPTPPVTAGRSVYVTNGSRTVKQMALTFDFGGRVGDAQAIVDYLIAHDVHATIFITGKQIDTTAEGPAVLARICDRASQFALGNHSYNHPDFDSLTPAKMRTELSTTEAAFARVCDRSPRPFFRPPSGALGGYRSAKYYEILDTVGAAGYSRTVGWDVDTLDWGAPGTTYYRTTPQIVSKVETSGRSGSIVLMHLGGYNTYPAIQQLVPWLRGQGYQLVTLHELLGV